LRSDPKGAPQFASVTTGGGAKSDTAGATAVVDLRLGDLRAPVPEIAAAERNPFRFKTGEAPMRGTPAVAGPAKDLPKGAPEKAGAARAQGPPAPPPILLQFVGLVKSTDASERVAVSSDSKGNVFYGKEGDIIDTLTVTFNPAVLRVRSVQDGSFMRQGGVSAQFTPQVDAAAGRLDMDLARIADGAGAAALTIAGSGSIPGGTAVPLGFSPIAVTVL
jgi:hypothetical protein